MSSTAAPRGAVLNVVLFSGGRGSGALTRELVRHAGVSLTLAINGYDDGASTGEVRRLLGDCLGPSDFRKNASRLAVALQTATPALVELLDARLPADATPEEALEHLAAIADGRLIDAGALADALGRMPQASRATVGEWLRAFLTEYARAQRPFRFGDCSVGNLVFAGAFLAERRGFNRAVDAYNALLGLPEGLIENVTDGRDAYLVAIDANGGVLASEGEIVDARSHNRIRDIYLIDRPLDAGDAGRLRQDPGAAAHWFEAREPPIGLNPRLAARLASADVIIYAPGTQHSSLFPSYMTPGLAEAIAGNLRAIKLLVTNIQTDAEISGSTAVDLVDRALFYLNRRRARRLPTPCLITHYLMNEPGRTEDAPYVPLGPVETIEDPRLVRIGNYEDGVTGRHDAARILGPFVETLLAPPRPYRLAVLLHDAGSLDKITQTLLEMVRGGMDALPLTLTAFYESPEALDPQFAARLPFAVRTIAGEQAFRDAVRAGDFDYVALFESSGMYRGEDLAGLASHLTVGRLDAVWGSRRLSVRDIQESYRLRYRRDVLAGAVSYAGSHVLSLAFLLFYGRYISDTLSGVRAIRAADAIAAAVPLTHKRANQYLLSALLRRKADVLELPVSFFPLSPERVKRTTAFDGLQSLATIIWRRVASPSTSAPPAAGPVAERRPGDAPSAPH